MLSSGCWLTMPLESDIMLSVSLMWGIMTCLARNRGNHFKILRRISA